MEVRTVVTSYAGGVQAVIATSEWVTVTQPEYDELMEGIKQAIGDMTYLTIGTKIIPGDFLRRNCTIEIVTL